MTLYETQSARGGAGAGSYSKLTNFDTCDTCVRVITDPHKEHEWIVYLVWLPNDPQEAQIFFSESMWPRLRHAHTDT